MSINKLVTNNRQNIILFHFFILDYWEKNTTQPMCTNKVDCMKFRLYNMKYIILFNLSFISSY